MLTCLGHAINIPAQKLPLLDKDPEVTEFMRTPVEAGGGYAAMLEVHHQLHCLVSQQHVWMMLH